MTNVLYAFVQLIPQQISEVGIVSNWEDSELKQKQRTQVAHGY